MNITQPILENHIDQMRVRVYETRDSMGAAAAQYLAYLMKKILSEKGQIRMVFAAAPSQNEFLNYLCKDNTLDWSRVSVFQMDDYIGLPDDHCARFASYLNQNLFSQVRPGEVHLIEPSLGAEEACNRYGSLLSEAPIDIVCLGIGENGHIAFNDPGVADFNDSKVMKPVQLDPLCRMQQVNDGCFPNLDAVPASAVTLTIPTLISAKHLVCVVPGPRKRVAVQQVLTGEITTECPASILRLHSDCVLFLDTQAYGVQK